MANFMGPMAPPQAAQPQPPQLDVRTNPAQRAQFKNFMTSMSAPMMPTTAPVAPMLAAPSPMDQIDIFAPVQAMASGGVVGGLQDLGKMSGQMVEALNTVVYGGGQGGGGITGGFPDTSNLTMKSPVNNMVQTGEAVRRPDPYTHQRGNLSDFGMDQYGNPLQVDDREQKLDIK